MDKKNRYVRKSYGELYSWCADKTIKKSNKSPVNIFTLGCTAVAGGRGEDWNTSYVYDVNLVDGITHKIAYVECDYVG